MLTHFADSLSFLSCIPFHFGLFNIGVVNESASDYYSTLDGSVIARCAQRHRHAEGLDFRRQIERETPTQKQLHLICDNYATHKHPKVKEWLEKHPRFTVHFTPTSASWLNRVERFFRSLSLIGWSAACSRASPN